MACETVLVHSHPVTLQIGTSRGLAIPCGQLSRGDGPVVWLSWEGLPWLQVTPGRLGPGVEGRPRVSVGEAFEAGPVRAPPLEGRHHHVWEGGGPIIAIISRVARAASPLQLRDGLVAHLVLGLVKRAIPKQKTDVTQV